MTKMAAKHRTPAGIDQAVLAAVPAVIEAVLGIAQVTVADLAKLSPGDSFRLDRKLNDPVELKLNGVTVAYGELVAVGDNFGVRIAKIATV